MYPLLTFGDEPRNTISMLTISKLTNGPHDNPAYRLASLIRELNASLSSRIAEHLVATGLTLPQTLAIKTLAHQGPLTMSEIARELCVSKPTAVGIVDRLEKQDILRRNRDTSGDRREVMVEFAPGNEEYLRGVRIAMDESLESAFSDLSEMDIKTLMLSLETALKALGVKHRTARSLDPVED